MSGDPSPECLEREGPPQCLEREKTPQCLESERNPHNVWTPTMSEESKDPPQCLDRERNPPQCLKWVDAPRSVTSQLLDND